MINSIHFKGKSNDSLINNLENIFTIKKYGLDELSGNEGIVIDLKETLIEEKDILHLKKNNAPMLLLNTTPEAMDELLGIGLHSRAIIVRYYNNKKILQPLDFGSFISEDGEEKYIESQYGEDASRKCSNIKIRAKAENQSVMTKLTDKEIIKMIEINLSEEEVIKLDKKINNFNSSPTDLPANQCDVSYIHLKRIIGDFGVSQKAENEVVLECTLIASYKPFCKYLTISTFGAGFHPSSGKGLQWDNIYDRGYFQEKINIHMEDLDKKLTTYKTIPKNINGQTSYSESSEFSVGVDIAKEPSFSGSYTIGQTVSGTISDFDILNNSSGSSADWNLVMGMTKNSIWDIFKEPFMKKAQVKGLPTLAKSNFQPDCTGIWKTDNGNFNERVHFALNWSVLYYNCWVTGNWRSYTKHYACKRRGWGKWEHNPCTFNFNVVNS